MLLKIKEAAVLLAICPKQVRKLINAGRLPVVPCGTSGRGDRIDEADIQVFIDENKERRMKPQSMRELTVGRSHSRLGVSSLEELLDRELGKNRQRKKKQNHE